MSTREARVLKWINRQRKELFGWSPLETIPRGTRKSSISCPIAMSLKSEAPGRWGKYGGVLVRVTRARVRVFIVGDDRSIDMPQYVRDFVDSFDKGRKPQYNNRELIK